MSKRTLCRSKLQQSWRGICCLADLIIKLKFSVQFCICPEFLLQNPNNRGGRSRNLVDPLVSPPQRILLLTPAIEVIYYWDYRKLSSYSTKNCNMRKNRENQEKTTSFFFSFRTPFFLRLWLSTNVYLFWFCFFLFFFNSFQHFYLKSVLEVKKKKVSCQESDLINCLFLLVSDLSPNKNFRKFWWKLNSWA